MNICTIKPCEISIDFGSCTVELMTSLETGPLVELYGNVDLFIQPSVDISIMNKSRKGLFAGIGVTGQITSDISSAPISNNFKLYYGVSSISGQFLIGYRF